MFKPFNELILASSGAICFLGLLGAVCSCQHQPKFREVYNSTDGEVKAVTATSLGLYMLLDDRGLCILDGSFKKKARVNLPQSSGSVCFNSKTGMAYVGSHEGSLYRIRLSKSTNELVTLLDSAPSGDLAISKLTSSDVGALYCRYDEVWSVDERGRSVRLLDTNDRICRSICFSDGIVYVGTGDRRKGTREDLVVAINISTMQELWRLETDDIGTMGVVDTDLIAASTFGELLLIERRTGAIRQRVPIAGQAFIDVLLPTESKDTFIASSQESGTSIIRLSTGTKKHLFNFKLRVASKEFGSDFLFTSEEDPEVLNIGTVPR